MKDRQFGMKKHFLTGLAILLPIVLTILIVGFIVNILTQPFLGIINRVLDYSNLAGKSFLFLSAAQVFTLFSKIVILFSLIALTVLVGFLGRLFIVNTFIRVGDYLIQKIPVINKIYKALQDVIHSVFNSKKSNFSQVVLVPFPNEKSYSLGLITNEQSVDKSDLCTEEMVSVFVPGTPNPTMGFMLLFKKNQVVLVDMKIEDALKFLVSCGAMSPELKIQPKAACNLKDIFAMDVVNAHFPSL